MNARFAQAVEVLHSKLEALLACEPLGVKDPKPKQGVYLFTEQGLHLYVGRSNNIPKRYAGHCRKSATHHSAAFAMLLARAETGKAASYKAGPDNRKHLVSDAEFKEAFEKAKCRIRHMQFRAIAEEDQMRQTLLEVYCAVALETPHNDFGTH